MPSNKTFRPPSVTEKGETIDEARAAIIAAEEAKAARHGSKPPETPLDVQRRAPPVRLSPAALARNTLQSGLTRAERTMRAGYEDLEKLIELLETDKPAAALRAARAMRQDLGKTIQDLRDQRGRYPARPERK